jgi:hypothetical protein
MLKLILEKSQEKNPGIYVGSTGVTYTVLHRAAWLGKLNIIELFKDAFNYTDINPYDSAGLYTPMLFAAQTGEVDVVKYYINTMEEEEWNKPSKVA